jgi:branched-chain amino acid transport system substrate-binding protein
MLKKCFLLLISLSLVLQLYKDTAFAEAKKFKVGLVLPLTGNLSIQGIPMERAATIAQKKFDIKNELELIVEDDSFLPRNTVSAVKKLVEKDQVQAVMIFGTNQGLAVVDYLDKKSIPFISVNVNRKVIEGKKTSFLLMPTLESLTALNVSKAKANGYKTLAIVSTIQDSCLMQKKIVEDSKIFEIVLSDEVAAQDSSLREIASKIARKNPDAVYLSVLPPHGSLLSKSLRELGYRGDLFGGLQLAYLDELKASQGALEGAWVVSGDDRKAKSFFETYQKKFESFPTAESVYVHDGIKLILEGYKSGDIISYLKSVQNFEGEGGIYSADGMNSFSIPVVAKRFTKDAFEYLD